MIHPMRNLISLLEALDLDWGDDSVEPSNTPAKSSLPFLQQRMLDRHRMKQDRNAFRSAEQRRREKEQQLFAPEDDYYGTQGSRHVPKSAVGYKPFKWPMIRFGKFRDRSVVGFDAEMRRDMGNITHESGVSCFRGTDHNGGYRIREHDGRSSWTVGFDPNRLVYPWVRQMRPQFSRWLRDGTPMDIFLIRGHLVSFGKNDEWLSCGSDGEYLLDTRKPYQTSHIDPDHLWIEENLTLRQFYESTPQSWSDDEDEDAGSDDDSELPIEK